MIHFNNIISIQLIGIMKFLIYYYHAAQQRSLELDCEGDGTKDNPIIIEPSEHLPMAFHIFRSKLHVKIQNCETSINLNSAQNITIKNCKSKAISVTLSSNITLKDCTIGRYLELRSSSNVNVEDCEISKIKFYNSSKNSIRNCIITKGIKLTDSEDNTIRNNIYPDITLEKRIREKSQNVLLKPRNLRYLSWLIILIGFIVIFTILPNLVFFIIFGCILIAFFIFETLLVKFLKKKFSSKNTE